ncbi:MAG: hypothetical protein QXO44_00820 [Thermoplasmatales archaeon]
MITLGEFLRNEKKISPVFLSPTYPQTHQVLKEYFDKYVSPNIPPEKRTSVFKELVDEYGKMWNEYLMRTTGEKPLEEAGHIPEAAFLGGWSFLRTPIAGLVRRVATGGAFGGGMEAVARGVEEKLKEKIGPFYAWLTGTLVAGIGGELAFRRLFRIPKVDTREIVTSVIEDAKREAGVVPSAVNISAQVSDISAVDEARRRVMSFPETRGVPVTQKGVVVHPREQIEKAAEWAISERFGKPAPKFPKTRRVRTTEETAIVHPRKTVREAAEWFEESVLRESPSKKIADAIQDGHVNPTMVRQAVEEGHIDPSIGIAVIDPNTGTVPVSSSTVSAELQKVAGIINKFPFLDRPATFLRNLLRTPWFNEVLRPLVYDAEEARRLAREFENTAKVKLSQAISGMSADELTKLGDVLRRGSLEKTVYSREQLVSFGLNEKQISAYGVVRGIFDDFAEFVVRVAKLSGISEEEIPKLRELAKIPGYFPSTRIDDNVVMTMMLVGDKWKIIDLPSFKTAEEAAQYLRQFYSGNIPREVRDYVLNALQTTEIPMDLTKIGSVIFNRKTGTVLYRVGAQPPAMSSSMASFMRFTKRGGTGGVFDSLPLLQRAMSKLDVQDDLVSRIAEAFGDELIKAYARGHFAHRRFIPGGASDWVEQVLEYLESVPLAFARRAYLSRRFNEHLKRISVEAPHLIPYVNRWGEWLMGVRSLSPTATAVNSLLYTMYLGMKPFFFAVNYTQRFVTTFWYGLMVGRRLGLSADDVVRSFLKAEKDQWRIWGNVVREAAKEKRANWLTAIERSGLTADQKELLKKMFLTGELEQSLPGIIKSGNRAFDVLHVFGSSSEKLNRIQTALFIDNLYRRAGRVRNVDEAFRYANEANYFCNFLYSSANRPEIARGMLGQILFLFKTYPINLMNLWKYFWTNDKTALVGSFATAFALAGSGAIPGKDAMVETALWIAEQFDPTARAKTYMMSRQMPRLITGGIPSLVGISGEVQWGNGELFSFAPIPYIQSSTRFLQTILDPDIPWYHKLRMISPTILKHEITLATMKEGWPISMYGRPPITMADLERTPKEVRDIAIEIIKDLPKEWPDSEKILYGLGATSDTLITYYRAIDAIRKMSRAWTEREKSYIRRMVDAGLRGDWDEYYKIAREAVERGHDIEERQITQELKGRQRLIIGGDHGEEENVEEEEH